MKPARTALVSILLLLAVISAACVPATPSASPEGPATQGPAATLPPPPPATPAPTVTPMPAATQPAESAAPSATPAALSLAALKNGTYPIDLAPEGQVTLKDGQYQAEAAPGSAQKVTIELQDKMATGDLNGDGVPDAAVVLAGNGGGSGTFYNLYAVLNQAGKPNPAASVLLGDRVVLKSVAIAQGEIVVDMVTQGPNDPLCCPSMAVTQRYRLQGGQLQQTGSTSPTPGPAGTSPAAAFTDPFKYCAAVGTIDKPDQRYTGAKMPPAVAAGLMQALELPAGTPPPPIAENSFWRCMDRQVYACTVGANLPCYDKADTNKTPTAEMNDYCKANPGSDFIPMYLTGHATVYNWRCKGATAEAASQAVQVDPQGYIASIWYKIAPPK